MLPDSAQCPKGCPLQKAGYPALITIPLTDYQALLKARLDSERNSINFKQLSRPVRSTVERDAEVCMFITLRLGAKPVSAIRKECRAAFGSRRTPSPQSIYRYWDRLRAGMKPSDGS